MEAQTISWEQSIQYIERRGLWQMGPNIGVIINLLQGPNWYAVNRNYFQATSLLSDYFVLSTGRRDESCPVIEYVLCVWMLAETRAQVTSSTKTMGITQTATWTVRTLCDFVYHDSSQALTVYWTTNDHSWKIADIYIHDLKSLRFYFSVCPPVCLCVYTRSVPHCYDQTNL